MARARVVAPLVIPDAITRVLALHGAVQLSAGCKDHRRSIDAHLAPFDDLLVLFVPGSSPILRTLERDPRADVQAAGGTNAYTLRLKGRAVDCGPAAGYERRLELMNWLPEGAALGRFHAVELVPERIEYAYDEGGERRWFEGNTGAASPLTGTARWMEASFGGIIPQVVLASAVTWGWIGWYGQWYTRVLQFAALLLALVGALGLLMAARLVFRALAFRAWQRGKGPREDAVPFSHGLLPLHRCWSSAAAVAVLAVAALVALAAGLEPEFALVGLLASQIWYLVPYWLIRGVGRVEEGGRPLD
ncbi:MAG: hypothetical protein ABIO70_20625 [Pseudomonadota bacterium]